MKKTLWNDGWKFFNDKNAFALIWSVPEDARSVTLPHDAMIETPATPDCPSGTNTGFRNGDCYTYVKVFDAPEDWKTRRVALRFDGVYQHAMVYVNGALLASEHQGYAPFDVPLNNHLNYGGQNEVRVQVRTGAMPNSRWYSGTGIYRDVWLVESESFVSIEPGTFTVRTLELRPAPAGSAAAPAAPTANAVVEATATLVNAGSLPVPVTATLAFPGTKTAPSEKAVMLFPGEPRTVRFSVFIPDAALWSAENPALTTAQLTLRNRTANDAAPKTEAASNTVAPVFDAETITFGIRTISADAQSGLLINGEHTLLRGACIHHDSGLIGAATFPEAEYRRVRILKEAGFNAIRMAHHHAAPALLAACDALGMYVMDEYSDMWTRNKSSYDYALHFTERMKEDVIAMVRDDLNHPSVIMYSVGNEIPEIGSPQGSHLCAQIAETMKATDPTRLTTAGINGIFTLGADDYMKAATDIMPGMNVNEFMTLLDAKQDEFVCHPIFDGRLDFATANLDVAGYNYMTARYAREAEIRPNRVLVGSETYPPEIARNWKEMHKRNNCIGDFTWTGWDYLGEAGIGVPSYKPGEGGFGAAWPCQVAYCGDIDVTGFRRPMSYYREVVFGLRKDPYICVQTMEHYGEKLFGTPWVMNDVVGTWDWSGFEGKPCVIEVYAPGDEVELFVNGTSLGKRPCGEAALHGGIPETGTTQGKALEFRTLFETVYQPGTVEAVCYAGGKEIGRSKLVSPVAAEKRLVAVVEPPAPATPANAIAPTIATGAATCPSAGADELRYVALSLCDNAGTVLTHTTESLTVAIDGDWELAAFGSANPRPQENFNTGHATTWNGRAQLILRRKSAGLNACGNTGTATVRVTSESGLSAEVTVS